MKYLSFILILFLGGSLSTLKAQYQVYGGFDYGFLNLGTTNSIISEFNQRESHDLQPITALSGYRFGFGRYAEITSIELGFGSLFSRKSSRNPALLKETAELVVNMSSVDASLAVRPFKDRFHSFGAALHMGQIRYRYSFGGDYLVPLEFYSIWGEVFIDIGIPFRFLIKREMRDKFFYVFRIRPYYKINSPLDISNVQRDFNEDPAVERGDFSQALNHLGLRISISIPFLSKSEQEVYRRGGEADQRRKRNRAERQRKKTKEMPKGRL
jgi:hypothetical protein